MDRITVIGASRGLGRELCRTIPAGLPILAMARKMDLLESLRQELGPAFQYQSLDLATDGDQINQAVCDFQPTKIFYLAGGGPYGHFGKKSWKDHQWAWEVSFLGAAKVIHAVLRRPKPWPQVVVCGSSVAESSGDANAASYAAAKHALRGLYESLRLEIPDFDLRLFSPGYLDTELLPKNAQVRYKGVWQPETLAKELWAWSSAKDQPTHLSYPPHP